MSGAPGVEAEGRPTAATNTAPPPSCREAAEFVVDCTLQVPSLRLRLATAPVTQQWRTPSLVILDAGGPRSFVVGLTRCVVDVYEGSCAEAVAVGLVEELHLRPSAVLSALWYAVFFTLPFVGSLLADLLAGRWIRQVRQVVVATMAARHGDRVLG